MYLCFKRTCKSASSTVQFRYNVLRYNVPSDITHRSGRPRQKVHTNPYKNTPAITYSFITYFRLKRTRLWPIKTNSSGYNVLYRFHWPFLFGAPTYKSVLTCNFFTKQGFTDDCGSTPMCYAPM